MCLGVDNGYVEHPDLVSLAICDNDVSVMIDCYVTRVFNNRDEKLAHILVRGFEHFNSPSHFIVQKYVAKLVDRDVRVIYTSILWERRLKLCSIFIKNKAF